MECCGDLEGEFSGLRRTGDMTGLPVHIVVLVTSQV